MTKYTIFYYDVTGYEEDGTEIYEMQMLECETQEDLDYYLAILNDEDIFDIEEA
jgi:hypothetical protein